MGNPLKAPPGPPDLFEGILQKVVDELEQIDRAQVEPLRGQSS
jgi:hypothetical protein